MPCWEVNTMSVAFPAKHLDVLKRAVDALGWDMTKMGTAIRVTTDSYDAIVIDTGTGMATVAENAMPQLNQLKVAYSQQALKKAAKAKGWQQNATSQKQGYLYR